MDEREIGKIVHYYSKIDVGIIELKDALGVGNKIHIKGHTSDFIQDVSSMQIEHADVSEAKSGDFVGIKLSQKVHPHDKVYKVTD